MKALTNIFKQHPHWPSVESVLKKLDSAGFAAYLAGGCVRDALLGQVPKDFDVAGSARPSEVMGLFPNCQQQGRAFGVAAVCFKGFRVEVAAFRQDGPYQDGRRPQYVKFLSAKEDAFRRDFTVNAMFYDWKNQKVIDYTGGLKDLQNKLIRTVGRAAERFQEDKLRIARALRFHIQLGFYLDPEVHSAVFKMKDDLWGIARERIYDEFLKMLRTHKLALVLPAWRKLGFLNKLHPEWGRVNWPLCVQFWSTLDQLARTGRLKDLKDDKDYRSVLWLRALYPLLIQTPTPIMNAAGKWEQGFYMRLKEWKWPLSVIKDTAKVFYASCLILRDIILQDIILRNRMGAGGVHLPPFLTKKALGKSVSLAQKLRALNSRFSKEILLLSRCYLQQISPDQTEGIEQLAASFKKRAPQGALPPPLVAGDDLKALGFPADQRLAACLSRLYDEQLEHGLTNKTKLLNQARSMRPVQTQNKPKRKS